MGYEQWNRTFGGAYNYPSNLDCEGSLSWTKIDPGATVKGNFTVKNIGHPESWLNWKIVEYPAWGTWTFNPSSMKYLPTDIDIIVEVSVVAPNEKHKTFSGEIKIVNMENENDNCTIPITLTTPVSTQQAQSHFAQFLERMMERFAFAFSFFEHFMKYIIL
jgi:hypothetical protein